ncbi:hypothetical protein WA158_004737, partial [Blastocystis sp. Blastoise]
MNTKSVCEITCGGLLASVLAYKAYKYFSKKQVPTSKADEKVKYFIGIDLGATNAKAGVVRGDGVLVARSSSSLVDYSVEGVVKALVEASQKAVEEAKMTFADITAIGVGSPGCIDFSKGVVTKASNFPTWVDVPLAQLIQDQTHVPTFLENDANAAVLAELWVGAGANCDNLVMLTLGSGIGGGVVTNGKLVHGGSGWAGEPGHQIYELEGIPCGCGQRGCYEKYASANAVINHANEKLKASEKPSSLRTIEKITAKDVVNAAKNSDEIALECVEIAAKALGICCVNLFRVLDPQVIVFTGGLANAGDFLLDKIKGYIDHYNWTIQPSTCQILPSRAGPDAGIIGAAAVGRA